MASVCEACVCKSGIHVATYRNLTESRRPCTISLIVSLRSSLTPLLPPHHPLQVAARCNKGVIPLSSRPGRAWLADDTWQRRFRTVNAAMSRIPRAILMPEFIRINADLLGKGEGAADAAPWFIRRRTSRFPAASSALRTRTFCSRTCGHHEPGLSLLSIGNNTRGKHLWKWLRQIVLVAWALPVECEHRTTSRQTQSANLGIYSLRLFRKERGRVVEIFIARQDRFSGPSSAESRFPSPRTSAFRRL